MKTYNKRSSSTTKQNKTKSRKRLSVAANISAANISAAANINNSKSNLFIPDDPVEEFEKPIPIIEGTTDSEEVEAKPKRKRNIKKIEEEKEENGSYCTIF